MIATRTNLRMSSVCRRRIIHDMLSVRDFSRVSDLDDVLGHLLQGSPSPDTDRVVLNVFWLESKCAAWPDESKDDDNE
jgi:hypothetical protein